MDFQRFIGRELSRTDVVLALIGDNWLKKAEATGLDSPGAGIDYVLLELESAIQHDIPIIPVLIGDAKMPNEQSLPREIRGLATKNAAEVHPGRQLENELRGLAVQIRRLARLSRNESPVYSKTQELWDSKHPFRSLAKISVHLARQALLLRIPRKPITFLLQAQYYFFCAIGIGISSDFYQTKSLADALIFLTIWTVFAIETWVLIDLYERAA